MNRRRFLQLGVGGGLATAGLIVSSRLPDPGDGIPPHDLALRLEGESSSAVLQSYSYKGKPIPLLSVPADSLPQSPSLPEDFTGADTVQNAGIPKDFDPFVKIIASRFESSKDPLDLLLGDVVRGSPAGLFGADQAEAGVIPIGPYMVRISWEKHYVGGCISRDTWHVGFMLKGDYGRTDICDFHVTTWWGSFGNACIGIYESFHKGINWCWCTNDLWGAIYSAAYNAIRPLLPWWNQWMTSWIAAAAAGAALGVLIAVPGVPPPP